MIVAHLLLAAAIAALGAAAVRVACALSDDLLERVVATLPLAASAAALHALGLGLIALGTSPIALCVAAGLTWLAVARTVPAPDVGVGRQLADAWVSLGPPARLLVGAAAGAVLAWTAWLLRYPAYDFDNLSYHIPEVVTWVREGTPGSIEELVPGWAYGNFPVTNEVLLSWGSGLGRSFVWLTIWPSLMFCLLAASGWLGLRALRVPALAAALATAALCAAPMATSFQANGANSDFPALVWLVATAALCAAAVRARRAAILAAALLAGALAVGTKTTTAPLAAIALAMAFYELRSQLRPLARPMVLTGAAALVVGGTWYVRNLVQHGSPSWPFFPAPWGDPAPYLVHDDHTFFERPLASVRRFGDPGYVGDTFLGSLVLLAGAIAAAFVERTRAVVGAAAATALSVFLWSHAPDTGAPGPELNYRDAFFGAPRLLMPGVAAATLTVALAARAAAGRRARLWTVVLGAAGAIHLWQLFDLGYPKVPTPATPLAGALLGALAAFVFARVLPAVRLRRPHRGRTRPWLRLAIAAAAVVALATALALPAPGLVDRHARAGAPVSADAELIPWFEGPADDGRPIHSAPLLVSMLAGPYMEREVEVIPRREACPHIEARARSGWVVVSNFSTDALFGPSTTEGCVQSWKPVFEGAQNRVYDARSLPVR